MRLAGRTAIITGASSGFGRATALRFAQEGARVVIADLDEDGGKETARQVAAAGSEAELVVGDISALAGARHAVARGLARFGRLDVLVNNAGISQTDARDTWNASEETWDRVIRINLRSVYACSKAAIPAMLERGSGSVVNIASIAASVCVGGSAYAATKGAILSYTRHVARELAARGRRCPPASGSGSARPSRRNASPASASACRCDAPARWTTSRTRSSIWPATSRPTSPVRKSWSMAATW
jgi:NAD(P)-dependent dehydrogenase (short-subunit alcohol dehydrogenase family)